MTAPELAETTDAASNSPLFHLIQRLADNKYWLGRRYAEWCTAAPTLESAVAASAMAQDEIGHARSHYPLFRQFVGSDVEPESQSVFHSMACLDEPFSGWIDFIAANFLIDTALTTIYVAAQDASFDDLRNRARRIVGEEQVHWLHARGWVRRLGAGNEAVRSKLRESILRVSPEVLMWFGPDDDSEVIELVESGELASNSSQLRQAFLQQVDSVLTETQLKDVDLASHSERLPWDRWDEVRYRLKSQA